MHAPVFKDRDEERAYLKHRLALAFRIFGRLGFCEGVAGHITVRDPVDTTSFWVNPFGKHLFVEVLGKVSCRTGMDFSKIRDCDLLRVTHAARPDVNCAAHSHSIYGRAFCATGRTLDMLSQDHCVFYRDHGLYGLVICQVAVVFLSLF